MKFEWDPEKAAGNVRKHGVTFEEVEEACLAGSRHARRIREGRYLALGITSQGRYLASFLARDEAFIFRLISARDMTSAERRLYEQHTTKGR